jgi:hypothetical protein
MSYSVKYVKKDGEISEYKYMPGDRDKNKKSKELFKVCIYKSIVNGEETIEALAALWNKTPITIKKYVAEGAMLVEKGFDMQS